VGAWWLDSREVLHTIFFGRGRNSRPLYRSERGVSRATTVVVVVVGGGGLGNEGWVWSVNDGLGRMMPMGFRIRGLFWGGAKGVG